ncbi:MAG: hypothetical protein IM473_02820 [Microcystis sp. M015S2]|uniref:hypothetical protein n=1 Tax=unclassified Microcystis TaxID=2643300 RepID=UPI0025891384|nr:MULTISPECIES: hypothetical protein [unclassified Microcystis]MCA2708154.1 hypothetical protein [Microcystis sp. M025S2]MCA2741368.1 hypothetical protein [Microcystis sp. M015S2]MCA2759616.1 hypothetical protein [Microcystis sp. M145S2]
MMLATETRVQVSILGYLSSDLKEAVGGRRSAVGGRQESGVRRLFLFIVPTPHTPHPTPHTPHPTPHFPEKAYSAIQANKNETFALRISPDW